MAKKTKKILKIINKLTSKVVTSQSFEGYDTHIMIHHAKPDLEKIYSTDNYDYVIESVY